MLKCCENFSIEDILDNFKRNTLFELGFEGWF